MLAEVGFVDAVEPLMEVARTSQNVLVRAEAIMALGRLGDGRAEQLLVEHIESPQPLLRVRAIEALARIGSPGAVPMLQKRLMEGTFAEQLGAARAIAASGAEAVNQLREIAEQGTGMPQAICNQVLEEMG
jgi:HEAT repeat protein